MRASIRIKLFDIVAVCVSGVCFAWSLVYAYGDRAGEPWIHVESADEEWILPQQGFRLLELQGPIGTTTIEVKDGEVRVIASPCSEKICLQTGGISKPGEWIACLPNRIFITVRAKDRKNVDAVSY